MVSDFFYNILVCFKYLKLFYIELVWIVDIVNCFVLVNFIVVFFLIYDGKEVFCLVGNGNLK